MNPTIALGRRSLREAIRQPDALFMTMFIPIFFLVVNTGQAADIFPSESTAFLEGQGYGAFQLPITLLLAASFGMAALFLVEEIEGGYFDKLRAIPIPRYAIVLGRLIADCERRGFRQMIAVIGDSGHAASIGVHAACGFLRVGTLRSVGFKFGRWVDSVLMQRPLGPGDASRP